MLVLGEPQSIDPAAQGGDPGEYASSEHTFDEVYSGHDDWNSDIWGRLNPALALA